MTKRAKRIQKLFTNPKNISFDELDTVLLSLGFRRRQPNSGSSHYTYIKKEKIITVPYKKPFVREVYIKRVTEIIGEIYEEES